MKIYFTCLIIIFGFSCMVTAQYIKVSDIKEWQNPAGYERIFYGTDSLQFGDLRIPDAGSPFPVAIIIHGGCYLSEYNLNHLGLFAQEVTQMGMATWSLEYRKIGDEGGGWPGTFQDISDGANYVRELAENYGLNLDKIVLIGHSSGGHAALWFGSDAHELIGASPREIALKGILALAAVTDLASRHANGDCNNVIDKLVGGSPLEVPERYRLVSPVEMSPIHIPQILIVGKEDRKARIDENVRYYTRTNKDVDEIQLIIAEESGHFELIYPNSSIWEIVRQAILSLLKD